VFSAEVERLHQYLIEVRDLLPVATATMSDGHVFCGDVTSFGLGFVVLLDCVTRAVCCLDAARAKRVSVVAWRRSAQCFGAPREDDDVVVT
jgi:hypothetical protein